MGLILNLQVSLRQECTTCEELIDEDRVRETIIAIKLFGTSNLYAVCPNCLQETAYTVRHDQEFRRKARVKMFELYGVVAKEL